MSGKNGHIITILMLALACITLASPVSAEEKRYTVPIGDSPSYGPPDAPVTIIEFIDFQ